MAGDDRDNNKTWATIPSDVGWGPWVLSIFVIEDHSESRHAAPTLGFMSTARRDTTRPGGGSSIALLGTTAR